MFKSRVVGDYLMAAIYAISGQLCSSTGSVHLPIHFAGSLVRKRATFCLQLIAGSTGHKAAGATWTDGQ